MNFKLCPERRTKSAFSFLSPFLVIGILALGFGCLRQTPTKATLSRMSRPVPDDILDAITANKTGILVSYDVRPDMQSTPRMLHITVTFDVPLTNGKPEAVSVQMPVWCPGDYHIQNFAQYVRNVTATIAADKPLTPAQKLLPVSHPDANTWTIQPEEARRITVAYDMPETPMGYFSENVALRDNYAFVNGASALMYLVGHKDARTELSTHLLDGWQAEMCLPQIIGDHVLAYANPTSTNFQAPDYDTLADAPLIMAAPEALRTSLFRLKRPTGDDVKPSAEANVTIYRPIFFGNVKPLPDISVYNKTLERIARAETQIMGGSSNTAYEFIFEVNGRGGGLEHLNACRLPFFPGESMEQAAPFIAHEFFHQWNVKRIRPRVLGPFDYIKSPRTRNLWFAEGVTDYYAWAATRRAGLRTEKQFFTHWRRSIAEMQTNPARLKVTADQASWTVWESGNSQGNGGLSYYDKGALIGLCLDLKIRHVTQNRRSLDDVMRALLQKGAPPHAGYGEDELRDVINTVAQENLTSFYNLLARSTQEMPFAECLSYAGLDSTLTPIAQATPAQIALRTAWAAETN